MDMVSCAKRLEKPTENPVGVHCKYPGILQILEPQDESSRGVKIICIQLTKKDLVNMNAGEENYEQRQEFVGREKFSHWPMLEIPPRFHMPYGRHLKMSVYVVSTHYGDIFFKQLLPVSDEELRNVQNKQRCHTSLKETGTPGATLTKAINAGTEECDRQLAVVRVLMQKEYRHGYVPKAEATDELNISKCTFSFQNNLDNIYTKRKQNISQASSNQQETTETLTINDAPGDNWETIYLGKILWMLLILTSMCNVQAAALPFPTHGTQGSQGDDSPKLFSYEMLTSTTCTLDMSDTCQINTFELKLLLQYCEFSCPQNHRSTCVNTQEGGSAYICLPSGGLTCKKGVRRVAWRDSNNERNLIIREETCPEGYFERYESDCFHACTSEHLNLDDLPEEFVVFSVGDSVSPTMVYCNSAIGYFNAENRTLLNYDQESKHEPYFCQNVNNFNPCKDDKEILPNGTCVQPCPPGFCRDDHADFVCTKTCGSKDLVTDRQTVKEVNTTYATTNIKQVLEVSEEHLDEDEDEGKEDEKGQDHLTKIAVIVGVILVFFLTLGVFVLVCLALHRKKRGSIKKIIKKKIVKPRVTVKTNGDATVNFNGESTSILGQQMTQHFEAGSVETAEEERCDEEAQQMELLKEPDGIQKVDDDQTNVKRRDDESTI